MTLSSVHTSLSCLTLGRSSLLRVDKLSTVPTPSSLSCAPWLCRRPLPSAVKVLLANEKTAIVKVVADPDVVVVVVQVVAEPVVAADVVAATVVTVLVKPNVAVVATVATTSAPVEIHMPGILALELPTRIVLLLLPPLPVRRDTVVVEIPTFLVLLLLVLQVVVGTLFVILLNAIARVDVRTTWRISTTRSPTSIIVKDRKSNTARDLMTSVTRKTVGRKNTTIRRNVWNKKNVVTRKLTEERNVGQAQMQETTLIGSTSSSLEREDSNERNRITRAVTLWQPLVRLVWRMDLLKVVLQVPKRTRCHFRSERPD